MHIGNSSTGPTDRIMTNKFFFFKKFERDFYSKFKNSLLITYIVHAYPIMNCSMQNVSNEPHCAFQFVAIDMDMGTLQHQQLLWTEHRRKQFRMNMNK